MSQLFVEQAQIVQAIVPVDFATADNTGDYVSLEDYGRCVFIVSTGIGTAGDESLLF